MRRPSLALPLLAAALALTPAAATAESPVSGSFELRVGTYRPDIDSRAGNLQAGSRGPYEGAFGTGRPLSFKLHVARALPWRAAGSLEVGVGAGFWQVNGQALDLQGLPTAEKTGLRIIPTEVTATWRLDVLWERFSVPLVPYARASLQRYNWWVTGPGGKTTKTGATNGYAVSGGVGLVLDLLDPTLARELDADAGVNQTLLTFDVEKSRVDDFGATETFDLSDSRLTYSVGLVFVF